ncbi:MAG: ribosome silencing factor [Candidatus Aenigmarchaeota archaeon]|nr:ribosome silencing factor [Candidatus Aenigmarchaeota archaeon]
MKDLDSREFACIIARIMNDKLALDIEILNIGSVSTFADYFVICSATSSVHVKTLTNHISGTIKNLYERLPQKEERDLKNRWNLINYSDVIVHIMSQEERKYYALEKFWSHSYKISADEWMEKTKNMKF